MADGDENTPKTTEVSPSGSKNPNAEPIESVASSSSVSEPAPSQTPAPVPLEDRSVLLDRARVFLSSPQIRHEEPDVKKRFLAEKGLDDMEIEGLLRESPQSIVVPPRTYPQPPPSNLPYLLMGLTRILTWVTGGSALLILIYYRFLLPRLTRSALARRALKQHQASLLARMNSSLLALKEAQTQTSASLPPPSQKYESREHALIHSLDGLNLDPERPISVLEFTLLRCAIEGLSEKGQKPTKEELFNLLEEKYSWLRSEEGAEYENSLWEVLSASPCFAETQVGERLVWTYTAPLPPSPSSPLLTSLTSLASSLPEHQSEGRSHTNTYQGTFDALADLTGYITTQTYQLASGPFRVPGVPNYGLMNSSSLGPQEEEIRREIRALKGLVLNRRTFATASYRGSSTQSIVQPP